MNHPVSHGLSEIELVMLAGALVLMTPLLRLMLQRIQVPPLVGFLGLGIGLALISAYAMPIGEQGTEILGFFGEIGIFLLLYRVGLESDPGGLLKQLRRASGIWLGNIALSGGLGFAAARWLLGMTPLQALFAGTALSATSVGVSVAVWQSQDALKTRDGETLIDVAEMDDLSAIVFMALLLGVTPQLREGLQNADPGRIAADLAVILGKLVLLAAACLAFRRWMADRVLTWICNRESLPDQVLSVVGIGILIGGGAALLGFSLAIGGFFAGLATQKAHWVEKENAFTLLYHFFTPFFFISVGLSFTPAAFTGSLLLIAVILSVAIFGKVAGTALPALAGAGPKAALALGISMVPRAEITLVVMEKGRQLGNWAVTDELYGAMILLSAVTCLAAPPLVAWMIRRGWAGKD